MCNINLYIYNKNITSTYKSLYKYKFLRKRAKIFFNLTLIRLASVFSIKLFDNISYLSFLFKNTELG